MARGCLEDRLFSVYCHITPNGKMYIGISCDPKNRWGSNGCNYGKNYRFYRAIKKYGWGAISHTILFAGLKLEQAKEIEIDLINRWHLTDFKHGYNLRDGGDGTFSLESRQKMSKSRMGNKNSVGRTYSDEVKAKISESVKRYYAEHPKKKKRKENEVQLCLF